jgi:signal transduction histidine kinase
LRQLEIGVDRATHLVQQLLTLARLDPDHGLTDIHPVDLSDLVHQTQVNLAAAAEEKEIALRVGHTFSHTLPGNIDALMILLRNLVDNAIRYTPSGGIVELAMSQNDGHVIVTVDDSGPGIPPDEREKVFQRFYRRLGTQAPGSGLGLSIVQRISELHHARLELAASPLGGLQVGVIFPLAATK